MEYDYVYIKKAKDFGRYCNFDDVDHKMLGYVEPNRKSCENYAEKTVMSTCLHNIAEKSQHSVNTARVQTKIKVMIHVEGGWPKEVDSTEVPEMNKFKKRLDKDPNFLASVQSLTKQVVPSLEQNNTIDLFEHYFEDEECDHLQESLSLKTVALFKDPSEEKRSVTKVGWHPEGPTKICAAYSNLRFQRMSDDMPTNSYIWDVTDRNVPLMELRTASPLLCCAYNPKNSDWLIGGGYNGILQHYDLKRGPTPVGKNSVEEGHYDPVYDVVWLQSKTGTECASVSSDGRLLFWDIRKFEVMDECKLTNGGNAANEKILGGVSLEWMQDAGPTKYLVGTEHGVSLLINRKPKKQPDIGAFYGAEERGGYGKHFGPVYALKRNVFHPKFFLSVGDWTAKLWIEDIKGPLLQTPYHPCFLTAAAWSPTRAGVFYLCRTDGRLDIWDYYYRMNEVSLSQKVSDASLTCINCQGNINAPGNLIAIGDSDGVVSLLQACDGLVNGSSSEKVQIGAVFERESKREKSLEQIKKSGGLGKKGDAPPQSNVGMVDETEFKAREKQFFSEVGISGDDISSLDLPKGK
jgi:dynein intermediate chain 2